MPITAQRLAQLLHEEFDLDNWGDIDPFLFKLVAEGDFAEDDDARALEEVLVRVVIRLRKDEGNAV